MEIQLRTIGERVEKFCATCNEQCGHIVKSVTKLGRVSRVNCSKCGLLGTFKASTSIIEGLPAKTGSPYDQTRTYRAGQTMMHPSFGIGEVTTIVPTNKIDVLFYDRVRRLIHSRI